MRVELQHEKIPISVTSIKPAVIDTPFWDNARTKLGVKPSGIPPYYSASLVADAILYTAEHPTRDFLVGDAARLLDFLQRLSPELVDSLLLLVGFPLQRSDVPKSEDAPNNLYEPVPNTTQLREALAMCWRYQALATGWIRIRYLSGVRSRCGSLSLPGNSSLQQRGVNTSMTWKYLFLSKAVINWAESVGLLFGDQWIRQLLNLKPLINPSIYTCLLC
jgi:hypothetical protein